MVEAGSHDETRRMTESFHRIGVIGAGAMGRGIAQLFASAGLPVRLYDSNPQTVEQALAFNRELLERAVAKASSARKRWRRRCSACCQPTALTSWPTATC